MKKWTETSVDELIHLFEDRPMLWDVHDKNYHKRDIREKAINEISNELLVPLNEIKQNYTV